MFFVLLVVVDLPLSFAVEAGLNSSGATVARWSAIFPGDAPKVGQVGDHHYVPVFTLLHLFSSLRLRAVDRGTICPGCSTYTDIEGLLYALVLDVFLQVCDGHDWEQFPHG